MTQVASQSSDKNTTDTSGAARSSTQTHSPESGHFAPDLPSTALANIIAQRTAKAAPANISTAVDLPIRPSISFSLEGEQDPSLLKLVDSVALSTLYYECFDQFAVRNPSFKPTSNISFRVVILVDKDLGIVTTGTTSDATSDPRLDNEFIECLEASSYGVSSEKLLAGTAQIPKDGTEAVIRVSLAFPTAVKTRKEQKERTEACFALLGYSPGDLDLMEPLTEMEMEEALEHKNFRDCMGLGLPEYFADGDEVALSNAEMQPCLVEAKKRNPKLPVKWIDGDLVPTEEWLGNNIDGELSECITRAFQTKFNDQ